MITDSGRDRINQYLAGTVPNIAQSISLGIQNTAAAATDTRLGFEVARTPITLTSYNPDTNELIFRAPWPAEYTGTIREIGLTSEPSDTISLGGSRTIALFNLDEENWTYTSSGLQATEIANGLIGEYSLTLVAGTEQLEWAGLNLDFSELGSTDQFSLAFGMAWGDASSVTLKFLTTDTDFYTITYTGTYNAFDQFGIATKASAVPTGSPDWGNITAIRLQASTGTSGELYFDALRIENNTYVDTDDVLVGRQVLVTEYVTGFNQDLKNTEDIEYTINISAVSP